MRRWKNWAHKIFSCIYLTVRRLVMPAFPRAQSASFISALNSFLEKEIAIHSSTLAWKIPWIEEGGRLQSMGSQRVGQDWETLLTHSLKLLSGVLEASGCGGLILHPCRGRWQAPVFLLADSKRTPINEKEKSEKYSMSRINSNLVKE